MAYVLDALKSSLDEEFLTSERLNAKSRQVFALAIGFFTIVQTVAFTAFEQDNVKGAEDAWLFGLTVAALLALVAAAAAAVRADSLLPSYQFSVEVAEDLIATMYPDMEMSSEEVIGNGDPANSTHEGRPRKLLPTPVRRALGLEVHGERASAEPPRDLDQYRAPGYLATYFVGLVVLRRDENDQRRQRYAMIRACGSISVAVTAIELISALAFRIP